MFKKTVRLIVVAGYKAKNAFVITSVWWVLNVSQKSYDSYVHMCMKTRNFMKLKACESKKLVNFDEWLEKL
ncbi:hypothetical protein GQX74_002614 [Glossina fuscipes]|nr:hypothetical protein GQX74_002614 [Glossina fuscipes]